MASNWYVDRGATGTNAGTSWTNACTSLATLLALGSPPLAGDSIFFNKTSAETYTVSTTFTLPGTAGNPNFLFSADTTNSPPQQSDLSAGAQIVTTGLSNLAMAGTFYCYGLTLSAGTGNNSVNVALGASTGATQVFDTCNLNIGSTASSHVAGNSSSAFVTLLKCSAKFNSTSQGFGTSSATHFTFKNCKPLIAAGSAIPSVLFTFATPNQRVFFEGCDLSALGSGKTLISGAFQNSFGYLKDCITNAAVTMAVAPTAPGSQLYFSRTDGSGTTNQFALYDYSGTELNSTAIYRTGGATAFDGTEFSKNLQTSGNAKFQPTPFESLPMSILNSLVGSTRTVTVYGTWDSAYGANTPPNNDDIWLEVEYPADSGDPGGGYATSTKAGVLATGTAYSSDITSTWNGTSGFTHPSPFSMSVSFTAQLPGPLTVRVFAGNASISTFYIDAKPVLS